MAASSGHQSGSTSCTPWVWTLVKAGVTAGVLYVTVRAVRSAIRRKQTGGKPLPTIPDDHWLLGTIAVFDRLLKPGEHFDYGIFKIMDKWPQLGKFFVMDFKFIKMAAVCDPDAAREILITQNLPKSPTYGNLEPFIGSKSMLTAKPEVWKKQRLAFSPGFAPAHIRSLVPMFAERCHVFLDRLQRASDKGDVVLLHNELVLLTMDVITRAVLSADLGYMARDEPPEMLQAFDQLVTMCGEIDENPALMIIGRHLPWVKRRFSRAEKKLRESLVPHITARLDAYDKRSKEEGSERVGNGKDAKKPQDILDMALAAAQADGGRLDFEEVLSQVKTFLFAGHDTTASVLGFTVYALTQHPDIEAKLIQEIDSVLSGRTPTADDLNNLKYTNAVIKESMRLWPVAGSARIGRHGDVVKGYDVSNVALYVTHVHVHRDPVYWGPNASEFVPERWLDEALVKALHPMAYMPFSKGPRDCIGQNFAMIESRTLLSMLYQRFTFKYRGEFPEDLGCRITTHPKYHVPVSVHPRKRAVVAASKVASMDAPGEGAPLGAPVPVMSPST